MSENMGELIGSAHFRKNPPRIEVFLGKEHIASIKSFAGEYLSQDRIYKIIDSIELMKNARVQL